MPETEFRRGGAGEESHGERIPSDFFIGKTKEEIITALQHLDSQGGFTDRSNQPIDVAHLISRIERTLNTLKDGLNQKIAPEIMRQAAYADIEGITNNGSLQNALRTLIEDLVAEHTPRERVEGRILIDDYFIGKTKDEIVTLLNSLRDKRVLTKDKTAYLDIDSSLGNFCLFLKVLIRETFTDERELKIFIANCKFDDQGGLREAVRTLALHYFSEQKRNAVELKHLLQQHESRVQVKDTFIGSMEEIDSKARVPIENLIDQIAKDLSN